MGEGAHRIPGRAIMPGGQILSHVELGAADKSLVKLLLRLKRELPGSSDLTEDEILDNILDAVDSIEVVRKGKVRRAKLYYLRGLQGKAAKIKEANTYR